MKVISKEDAKMRLNNLRQGKITIEEITQVAQEILALSKCIQVPLLAEQIRGRKIKSKETVKM